MSTTTTTQNASAQFPSPAQAKKVTKKDSESKTTTESKPKKPSLKEKHSRFLVSNYTLIQHLAAKGLLTEEGVESAYGEIKLFAPVEDQEAFYETYITESKTTKKTMKKFVTQRNKPPKAPRKSRAKKAESATTTDGAKEKKPRAKKSTKVDDDTNVDIVADNTAELVNELTAAATTALESPVVESQTDTTTAPEAPKKARKPRAKKTDTKEGETKEKKPRGRKTKKETEVAAPVVQETAENDEEEEIHTQEITIGDKLYLIDSDNNLYSHDTHEQVGTFDSEKNAVVAM
tara:strand:+ start:300 stop:1169 length:870 start_codon:yes stop_codon:yes gene_type:complete